MMKKNHEILDEYLEHENFDTITDGQYHHIKLAMDEFAMQEVNEFIIWADKNNWQQMAGCIWWNFKVDYSEQKELTTLKLYVLYKSRP